MKKTTLFLFLMFCFWQTDFAQFTKADLIYKCDFEAGDPFWKAYNEKVFVTNTIKGKFVLEHTVTNETWSQNNDMGFNPMQDYQVEVSLCQLSGKEDNGYGICYNYKGPNDLNAFNISANGYFTIYHYSK